MKLYDISPTISPRLKVWPGDTPPERRIALDIARGDNLTLSSLHATVHLGAHADAPSHYAADGRTIESQDLGLYVGPCRLITVDTPRGCRVPASAVPDNLAIERLLIRTGSFPDPESFNQDFVALEPGLIDALAAGGVRLVGIDTPSVDLFDAKDLPAHKAFHRNDMAILEGLVLHDVPDGYYELIALPMRLAGFDASPVRAVLRELAEVPKT